jgi:hypothetical protein
MDRVTSNQDIRRFFTFCICLQALIHTEEERVVVLSEQLVVIENELRGY